MYIYIYIYIYIYNCYYFLSASGFTGNYTHGFVVIMLFYVSDCNKAHGKNMNHISKRVSVYMSYKEHTSGLVPLKGIWGICDRKGLETQI